MNIRQIILILSASILCACSDKIESENHGNDAERWPSPTESINANAVYYGDYYEEGTGLFMISLSDNTLVYDTGLDFYKGEGDILSIFINTELMEDPNNPNIPEGSYEEGKGKFTFRTDDNIYTSLLSRYDGNGNLKVYKITGGAISIKESSGYYWIKCDMKIDNDGISEPYSREFIGIMDISNNSEEGFISNLEKDVQCDPMKYAEFVMQKNNSEADTDTYSLFMATDYDASEGSFEGDALLIYLNVPAGENYIPSGTYTVLQEPFTEKDLISGTVIPGSGSFETNNGSWFYSFRRQLHAQIKSGKIVIMNDGSEYSITASFKDGNGYSITASYNGKIDIY